MFLGIGVMGFVFSGPFFMNFIQKIWPGMPLRLYNAGTIVINNLAIGIKVCGSVFLIMLFLCALRVREGTEIYTLEDPE